MVYIYSVTRYSGSCFKCLIESIGAGGIRDQRGASRSLFITSLVLGGGGSVVSSSLCCSWEMLYRLKSPQVNVMFIFKTKC